MIFYVLRSPPADSRGRLAVTDYTPIDPVRHGEAPKCPECDSCLGQMPWLAPHRAELEPWTNGYGDIAFGPLLELVISEAFAERFRAAGLTGLAMHEPVEIVRVKRRGGAKQRDNPPSYFCALPIFSQTRIDLNASGLETEEPVTCDACRSGFILRYARVAVEEQTWAGDDIFFARGLPGIIIASERFAEWFAENEINNGELVLASESSEDFYPGG